MKRMKKGVTRQVELTGDISCFFGGLRDGGGLAAAIWRG